MILDDQVVDWLMPGLVGADNPSPSAFIVYMFLWRTARRSNSWIATASHQTIAEGTGLSRSAVQGAIRLLNKRPWRVIRSVKKTATSTPKHHVLLPWRSRRTPRRRATKPTTSTP